MATKRPSLNSLYIIIYIIHTLYINYLLYASHLLRRTLDEIVKLQSFELYQLY